MGSALPEGLVTFVMTDIEGSTRMHQRLGDRWPALLATSQELIRSAVEDAGGMVWRVAADEVFAAFVSPADALRAAVDAQHHLQSHPWKDGNEIRVRIGIHRGVAERHGDDYVSLALHHAARIRDAGHGGQVIASADAVAEAGVLEVPIRFLGPYRLRDVEWPLRLVQIGSAEVFPSLRFAVPVSRLPEWPTTLVGRNDDLLTIAKALAGDRLVTVVGPGGVGKTRAAVTAATEDDTSWPGGIWFCDLTLAERSVDVPSVVATALGIEPGPDPTAAIVDHVEGIAALVVLDNCEHVVGAAAALAGDLIAYCRHLRVLATSRTALGVPGENVVEIRPLPLPAPLDPLEQSVTSPAMTLFCARAAEAYPALRFGDEELALAADLCRALDGLPLALELAAARLDVFGLADVADGLLEPVGREDGTSRHASLERVIDWSVSRVPAQARTVLSRLSVLNGPFDLSLATAVASDGVLGADDVAGAITTLVGTSLLERAPSSSPGRSRYRILATVRARASRLLADEGDADRTLARLFEHIAAAFEAEAITGVGPLLRQLSPSVGVAIDWAVTARPAEAAALVMTIGGDASDMGLIPQLVRWLGDLVEVSGTLPSRTRGRILAAYIEMLTVTLEPERIPPFAEELRLIVAANPEDLALVALLSMADSAIAATAGDWAEVRRTRDEAIAAARICDEPAILADILACDATDGLLIPIAAQLAAIEEIRSLPPDRVRPALFAFCDVFEADIDTSIPVGTRVATLERIADDSRLPMRIRGEAALTLAVVLSHAGRWRDAVGVAERAYRWALDRGDVGQQIRAQDAAATALSVPGHCIEGYRRREQILPGALRRMPWAAPGLLVAMAEQAFDGGRIDLAQETLATWAEVRDQAHDPEDDRVRILSARIAEAGDDLAAAEGHLREVTDNATDHEVGRALLAVVLARAGRPAEALDEVRSLAVAAMGDGLVFALECAAVAVAIADPSARGAAQRALDTAARVRERSERPIVPGQERILERATMVPRPADGGASFVADGWGAIVEALGR